MDYASRILTQRYQGHQMDIKMAKDAIDKLKKDILVKEFEISESEKSLAELDKAIKALNVDSFGPHMPLVDWVPESA